jgi:hypothetical protein
VTLLVDLSCGDKQAGRATWSTLAREQNHSEPGSIPVSDLWRQQPQNNMESSDLLVSVGGQLHWQPSSLHGPDNVALMRREPLHQFGAPPKYVS